VSPLGRPLLGDVFAPMTPIDRIRNLAIIAHIDHGKTTLIDSMFRAAHAFRENQQVAERIMDSNELERERGITIRSKHCTVTWGDYLVNIVDTPGHADFSGEVERVLSMVDSVLLLVDAYEGPMPQTRYVLMRSLRLGLKPIVLINKVDRPNAQPELALDRTFDLFIELGASDAQADFPVLFGSGLDGWFVRELGEAPGKDLTPLFETIIEHVPAPDGDQNAPFLMQVSALAWSDYIGRIGCGRVLQGRLRRGDPFIRTVSRWRKPGRPEAGWDVLSRSNDLAVHLWVTHHLERTPVDEISAGDIVWVAGPAEINIGDTFSAVESEVPALPPLDIEEPTVSMFFLVNNGPLAGEDGRAVTLRQIRHRLERELRVNVALRMEEIARADGVKVSGRGELHLSVLIEEMRREGMELCVSRPEVITHVDDDGKILEPIEQLIIDVPEEYQGVVIEKLARRKGELMTMENHGTGVIRMIFEIPTRGLIGYRTDFLTDTRGLGIMAARFIGYGPWRGDVASRNRGSLVSLDTGQATAYQLATLQQRAVMFIDPNEKVYAGQIVGENSRPDDMPCNPTKRKAITNHRSSTKEQYVALDVPRKLSLEQALEWIAEDELVEVTPKSIRVRKSILSAEQRKKLYRQQIAAVG
jgi:GTP-binding protein